MDFDQEVCKIASLCNKVHLEGKSDQGLGNNTTVRIIWRFPQEASGPADAVTVATWEDVGHRCSGLCSC